MCDFKDDSHGSQKPLLVSIVGPTAVGKTSLGIKLANHYKTEIISADSRQLYKEMTIGTAKPSKDELAQVRHHFVDSHSILDEYSAGFFEQNAKVKIAQLGKVHPVLFVVGGSTLYLKAIWEGFDEIPKVSKSEREILNNSLKTKGLPYLLAELKESDPEFYQQVDHKNGQRIVRALEVIRSSGKPFSSFRKGERQQLPYKNLKVGIELDREALYQKINGRMDVMIRAGLFDEASALKKHRDLNALQTVGYKEIFEYLDGKYDRSEAIRLLKRNTRRYAKRQLTWLRSYDDIFWYHPASFGKITELIDSHLSQKQGS
ncbi:MAG: tRNA (adenosine(37)-N6)-dimethylallyltransferase MiaA [Bacteroidota bacterium]